MRKLLSTFLFVCLAAAAADVPKSAAPAGPTPLSDHEWRELKSMQVEILSSQNRILQEQQQIRSQIDSFSQIVNNLTKTHNAQGYTLSNDLTWTKTPGVTTPGEAFPDKSIPAKSIPANPAKAPAHK